MVTVTNSAFLGSSVRQAAKVIKREEYVKECNQAAALIQRNFRKHTEERASTFSPSKSSFAIVSSEVGNSSATTIALTFYNDDDDDDDRSIGSSTCTRRTNSRIRPHKKKRSENTLWVILRRAAG
jgi:hypothetical protein